VPPGINIPTTGPLAWIVVVTSLLIAFAPLIVAHFKKPDAHVVLPVTAAQPQLDAGNALLATLVANLEKRTSAAEDRANDYIGINNELRERLARAESEIAALKSEIAVLTARLMERGRRRDE
jgi:peptidoglycan hydrolase CwlO-like protein